MKISGDRPVVNLEDYIKNNQKSKALDPSLKQWPKRHINKDSVKQSSAEGELQRARKIVEVVPEVREGKVLQFKRALKAGTYDMRGDKIAEKILRESLIEAMV